MTKEDLFSYKPKRIDREIMGASGQKWDSIQKPIDGLGDFEKTVSKILAANEDLNIENFKKVLVVMCADHGIVEEGVSQSGQDVTLSVARVLGENKSTASAMAAYAGVDVITVDAGINTDEEIKGVRNHKVRHGTDNFLKGPAMSEDEVLKAIEIGVELAKECKDMGYNIIAAGEMGIGNTTSGTAMLCALTGIEIDDVIGRGAGLSDAGLLRKKNVIETALRKYHFISIDDTQNSSDSISLFTTNTDKTGTDNIRKDKREYTLDVMSKVGGLELAAMTGLFIGGAVYGIPVMIDGLLSAVSALCAEYLVPGCKGYMIPSHSGRERGTGYVLDILGLKPLINGNMALGEGTGALMTFPLIDMAFDFYNNALTFEKGNVEQYVRLTNPE